MGMKHKGMYTFMMSVYYLTYLVCLELLWEREIRMKRSNSLLVLGYVTKLLHM